jgi:molybdenum cofactor synthesis domain-containing protein
LIKEIVTKMDAEVIDYQIIPDEKKTITEKLVQLVDQKKSDLVLTTGGTGFSPRDHTPEATLEIIEKRALGLEEAMRMVGYEINKRAVLSRGVCGIRDKSLIINLPGSPKAIGESLQAILSVLPHAIEVLKGEAKDCDAGNSREEK